MNSIYFKGKITSIYFFLFLMVISCNSEEGAIKKEVWGNVTEKEVYLYTFKNSNGMEMKITNYGGTITSVIVPDKDGNFDDVVLGFDNLKQYLAPHPCFGATIGRFANRIKDGEFKIDGNIYSLVKNDKGNTAHGANEFDKAVWDSEIVKTEKGRGVKLHYMSSDGANGFPGNLEVYVTYTLTNDNAIEVHFEAETDKATHINLTQHSYFNLSALNDKIYDHVITIDADNYTEIDEEIVPTGVISSLIGKDWDLTKPTRIGDNIGKLNFNGYHYNYVFNKKEKELKDVITVIEPNSGRTLNVITTQPGVQFYTGNAIDDKIVGKKQMSYGPHDAFCLETQHFPDTPNHSNFPSTLIRPGKKYDETVIYKFGVVK
ncbi:aldose 1-epimerase [Maribacter vaceletii]|uniref:Aldose 1-epimerase n=1 Tax=Maribacter vaceletii TaxID=1206816 RepID=A0A495E8B4_9FLAO|nr:aldose epimerase family protein [Maribacter vaceletii]RKR13174.1 aldose 1-epimerase [Maribacter vaceletii]